MNSTHTFPFIRTILGDISSDKLGLCYSHEHIVIDDSYPTVNDKNLLLNDLDKIVKELKLLHQQSVRTMVDTMPVNAGRNIRKLAEVSRRSGMQIIAATGIHLEIYYPSDHWRYHYSEDQLAQLFVDDIETGIDFHDYGGPIVECSPHKAGIIKLATGDEPITKHQEKIFRAVVNAHLKTGVPVLTHTNYGKHALAQIELFDQLGADLSHLVLSHVDRFKDVEYNREILKSGVFVEYDSAFRWKSSEENWTYKLLENLLPEFPRQITMGMDAAKHAYWKSYGGEPGLDFLVTKFKDDLQKMGLGEYFNLIFQENPKSIFSFKSNDI
ncbi:MAG: TatD family hydrolase [Balneolaceae bacterium]|nr:TatD family hydrolase [Balneolaceae bacterium]